MAEREGARKSGMEKVISTTPDVCKTPIGAADPPVPYNIVGEMQTAVNVVPTVRLTGHLSYTKTSKVPHVKGDEPGTKLGVQSGTVKGTAEPITASTTVNAGGNPVVRHDDIFKMNTGNTVGKLICSESGGGGGGSSGGSSNPPLQAETAAEAAANGLNLGDRIVQDGTALRSDPGGAMMGVVKNFANGVVRFIYAYDAKGRPAPQAHLKSAGEVAGNDTANVSNAIQVVQGIYNIGKFFSGLAGMANAAKAAANAEKSLAGSASAGGDGAKVTASGGGSTPTTTNPLFQPGPYAGKSLAARSASQVFNAAERKAGNAIGYSTGCHTCGEIDPGTISGDYVLDHQPISAFNTENAPQRLYPQCINCSRQQGLAVARELRKARR